MAGPGGGTRTGGRRCRRPGNTNRSRSGGRPRAVAEVVALWRTSSEDSMADMKAGSRVPDGRKIDLVLVRDF